MRRTGVSLAPEQWTNHIGSSPDVGSPWLTVPDFTTLVSSTGFPVSSFPYSELTLPPQRVRRFTTE